MCELRKREKKTSYLAWPSWMLARHMAVCGGRNCGVR